MDAETEQRYNQTLYGTAAAVASVPIYHLFLKDKLKVEEEPPKKSDAPRRRSRRPSVLEELTSAPLVLRVLLWAQCFQGLAAWLAPRMVAGVYGVKDMTPLDTCMCEDFGRIWVAIHFSVLIGGRKGGILRKDTVISSALILVLLSELKALLNDEYYGHTPSRVMILIVVKLLSLWAIEYGPDLAVQEGPLAETVSMIIPSQEIICNFLAFFVTIDGASMYFAPAWYAKYWWDIDFATANDEVAFLVTPLIGYSYAMVGVLWFAICRDVNIWKAFGLSYVIYFVVTVKLVIIDKSPIYWEYADALPEVDLILSFIGIISSEPWKVFM